MPVLRHIKHPPSAKRCTCTMCKLHKQNKATKRWMIAHPIKVTYLQDGVSTNKRIANKKNPFKQ